MSHISLLQVSTGCSGPRHESVCDPEYTEIDLLYSRPVKNINTVIPGEFFQPDEADI